MNLTPVIGALILRIVAVWIVTLRHGRRTPLRRLAIMLAALLILAPRFAMSSGFLPGHLLLSTHDSVYMLDPVTNRLDRILFGQPFLRDLVYDPITDSAFIVRDNGFLTEIMQLKWSETVGFETSVFLSGLLGARGLAVDRAGNLYFGDYPAPGGLGGAVFRATPAGEVSTFALAPSGFLFAPRSLAFSPDESKLYVATLPGNSIEVISGGTFSKLAEGLALPSAVETGPDGTVFAVEGFRTTHQITYFPQGAGPSENLRHPWMVFAGSDLTFDEQSETLYVTNFPFGIYAVRLDGTFRSVGTAPNSVFGHDIISRPTTVVRTWNRDFNGNWSTAGNWSPGVPNVAGAHADFGEVITTARTVTVDVPVTVGRIAFDNANAYTLTGSNAITLDSQSGPARIDVLSGSHAISAPVALADDAVITVTPAASALTITGNLDAAGRTLTKAGAGALVVNNVRAAGLTIDGGSVAIAADGMPTGTSVVSSLSVAGGATPTAKLDVNNNAAIVNYSGTSPLATVRSQIVAGRGGPGFGGTWSGQGITSTAAAAANATEAESRSVAIVENGALPLGPYTTFAGQPVDNTSLLIAFTRTGDANLDGVVNDDDVTIVGASYAPGVAQASWALGDFDYNGFVDDDDVTLLGVFYDPSAPPLVAVAPDASITVAAVPEPKSFILFLVCLIGLAVMGLSKSRCSLLKPP
jgi:hypothetical protein